MNIAVAVKHAGADQLNPTHIVPAVLRHEVAKLVMDEVQGAAGLQEMTLSL
jgi:hypothetical protein